MSKPRLATVWLDGCSGCHMSLLDTDERLLDLLAQVDLVYGPLVDHKTFPEQVDVALVEGAVASVGDIERIRQVRERTRILVAMGDCAVSSNVPSMRNPFGAAAVLERAYGDHPPTQDVPKLLERVRPVHEVVDVDVFVQGCPPSADTLFYTLSELLAGRTPELASRTRFGA